MVRYVIGSAIGTSSGNVGLRPRNGDEAPKQGLGNGDFAASSAPASGASSVATLRCSRSLWYQRGGVTRDGVDVVPGETHRLVDGRFRALGPHFRFHEKLLVSGLERRSEEHTSEL